MMPIPKRANLIKCALFAVLTVVASEVQAGAFPYWGVTFGTPVRAAARLGVSFGDAIPVESEGLAVGTGTQVEACVGRGGAQFGIGRSVVVLTEERPLRALADLKAVAIRTWDRSRGASPRSTYLGVEGGVSVSIARLTLGVAKRLESRALGANVLFTWGLGLQIRMGRGRPRASSDE